MVLDNLQAEAECHWVRTTSDTFKPHMHCSSLHAEPWQGNSWIDAQYLFGGYALRMQVYD